MKKKPLFTRGYGECRDRVSAHSKFIRSCFNCDFYYQASGDKEEVCQNPEVLPYDMVVEGNNIYCLKWCPLSKVSEKASMFKRGRSKLD